MGDPGTAAAAYAQVLALGLPWVVVHCGAMCGPIVAGLGARLPTRASRVRGLGAYLLGRALIYVPLGAVAGGLGHALEIHPGVGAASGILLAATLLAGMAQSNRRPTGLLAPASLVRKVRHARGIVSAMRGIWRLLEGGTVFPLGIAGFVLGLLPCMLPVWVLGLAATTGSALHGATLMAMLLAMTALPLAGAFAAIPGNIRGTCGDVVPRAAMGFAALWLLLGAFATLHIVPHGHVVAFARSFTLW